MRPTSGTTTSVWMATTDVPSEKTLDKDISTNVCIIGAGIAGLTTAYLLAREGKGVVVLDDGPTGGGMTARTTAHLTNALDDRFYELERLFGEEGSRLAGQSHTAAIDRVEAIVREEKIDCEFERVDGYLFLPANGKLQVLEDELPAAQRAGLTAVRRLDRAPLESFDTGPCLHFPRQGQFHPLKYLTGLAGAIERDGGRIFTGTHADKVEGGEEGYVTTPGGYKIRGGSTVGGAKAAVEERAGVHT